MDFRLISSVEYIYFSMLTFSITANVAGFEVWINTNPSAVEFGDPLEVNCSTTCAHPSMTVEYKPGIHPNRTNGRDWITDRFPSVQKWDLVVPCSIICLSVNKLKEKKKVVTVYNRELKITSPPEALKVNKTYSLECIGPRVYPKNKLILTWLRGSEIVQRVSTGEKGSPDDDKRLWNVFNFTASASDDGQEYTCLAEVDLGSNTTKPITNSSVTLQTYSNVAGFEVWINIIPSAVEFGDPLEVNCSTTCADPSMTVEYKPGIHPNRTNSRDWITDRFPSIQKWDLVVPCSIICLSDNNKLKEEKKVVTVYNRELKITSPPEVLKVNKTYSLECIGPRVYPKNKLILTWLRGSEIVQRVSTGEKGFPDEDKRLWNVFNFTASVSDDGQEYTCLAEVDLGSNTTKPITNSSVTLQTYYPPTEAQVRKTADDWIEGKSQTLSCNAAGNPAPQVSWIKDEQIYFGEKLHIPSVQLRDGGQYVCRVTNEYGSKISSLNAVIMYKPQNTSISVNNKTVSGSPIHVSKGDEVTMTCDTNGNPPATFQWEAPSKGSNDETGPPGVLRISRATSEHHGIYKCRATNKYGTDENEVDIRVKGQTSARRLAAKVLGFTSVAIIAAAVLITMIIYFRNKRKESKKQQE